MHGPVLEAGLKTVGLTQRVPLGTRGAQLDFEGGDARLRERQLRRWLARGHEPFV